MNRRSTTAIAALLTLCGTWLIAPPGRAMSMQPLNVADLTTHATHIVKGTVVSVHEGVDQNHLPYTEIELKVSEAVKGSTETSMTFRQFGLQTPQAAENGHKYVGAIEGLPRYTAGDHVLLFLGPVSSLGYRTTVGLGQGHFALRGGNYLNDSNNAGLFSNVSYGVHGLNDVEKSMTAVKQGAVGAETFVSLVRRAVAGKWWEGAAPGAPRPRNPRPTASAPPTVGTEGGVIQ